MNNKLKYFLGISIFIGLGIIVLIIDSPFSDNENFPETQTNSSSQDSIQNDNPQNLESDNNGENETEILVSTLKKAGIGCSLNESNESVCSYESVQYTLNGPADWQSDVVKRNQACEQGLVNSDYQILERVGVYYFTTDNNSDLNKLQSVLDSNGLKLEIVQYCS